MLSTTLQSSIEMNTDTAECVLHFFILNYSLTQIWTIVRWLIQLHTPLLETELRLGPGQQRGKTTLTTAFFGLACSWCISMSCSGLALWTRLSTLNQPLDGVRGSSESETQQTWNWKLQCEVPLATTRGNFVPTNRFYRETPSQDYMTATVWWWLPLNTCRQRTWHLLETLHIFGRSSRRSQCSVHSPSHDCPIFPYRKDTE